MGGRAVTSFYCLRFLSASISRRTTSIIATIKIPVWIRSEYVTMAGPLALSRFLRRATAGACKNRSAAPLTAPCFCHWQRSLFVPLAAQSRTRGAYRLPFIDNTRLKDTITASQWQEPPSKWTEARFVVAFLSGSPAGCPLRHSPLTRPVPPLPRGEASARPWVAVRRW